MNVRHGVIVCCLEVMELEVGLLMRHFRSSVFCERDMDKNLYNTLKERKKKSVPLSG